MEQVTIKTETWGCPNCPYKWQFSSKAFGRTPYDLTIEELEVQFSGDRFLGLLPGQCPSCYLRGFISPLGRALEADGLSEITVASDDELAAKVIEVQDEQGYVMEQTGVKQQYELNQDTGEVASKEVPIMAVKTRELTKSELAEEIQKRDQKLDELTDLEFKDDSVAVLPAVNEKEETIDGEAIPLLTPGKYKVRDLLARAELSEDALKELPVIMGDNGVVEYLDEGEVVDLPAGNISLFIGDEERFSFIVR